jgi:hypothetical protein
MSAVCGIAGPFAAQLRSICGAAYSICGSAANKSLTRKPFQDRAEPQLTNVAVAHQFHGDAQK